MKNAFSIRLLQFLAAICLLSVIPAKALQSGDFTYTTTATAVTITGYTGTVGVVWIPERIGIRRVTSIGNSAFYQKSLTSVTIPDSVTTIGDRAFMSCSSLTSVTIGSGVTSIGDDAFSGCFYKASVEHPNVTIPISVSIPNSVISIGKHAFSRCYSLSSVTIGSGLSSIGFGAFFANGSLTNFTVNSNNLSYSAVSGVLFNKNQTKLVRHPGGGMQTDYSIPNGVTCIGEGAFSMTSLKNVTIPDGVIIIENYAFAYSFIETVTISSSVIGIGYGIFDQTPWLYKVHFLGDAPSDSSDPFAYYYGATVYYNPGTTGWESTWGGSPTFQWGASISSHPINMAVSPGTSASFTVTASGAASYQWQKNGVNISSATTATLTLNNVQSTDAANYQVIIYNPAGNLTSNAATLTVLTDTDTDTDTDGDGDGLSDADEINIYHTNPLLKDSDGDGFDDGFEVNAKFNPNLASSSPESALSISSGPGTVTFRFNAGLGLSYRIEDSTDLQNWNTLETPIVGAGVEVTRYYPVAGKPKRYFRVKKN